MAVNPNVETRLKNGRHLTDIFKIKLQVSDNSNGNYIRLYTICLLHLNSQISTIELDLF